MGAGGLLPEGEALRRAVAWLAEHPARSLALVEEASQRFDLSPLDAAVLFRYFSPTASDHELDHDSDNNGQDQSRADET